MANSTIKSGRGTATRYTSSPDETFVDLDVAALPGGTPADDDVLPYHDIDAAAAVANKKVTIADIKALAAAGIVATSVDHSLARYDGPQKVQGSPIIVDDFGSVTGVTDITAAKINLNYPSPPQATTKLNAKITQTGTLAYLDSVGYFEYNSIGYANNVGFAVYGLANVTDGTAAPGVGHYGGMIGLAKDVIGSLYGLYGLEGRTDGLSHSQYVGTLGLARRIDLLDAGTFTGQCYGVVGRVEIVQSDDSTALTAGTARAFYAPTIVGGQSNLKHSFYAETDIAYFGGGLEVPQGLSLRSSLNPTLNFMYLDNAGTSDIYMSTIASCIIDIDSDNNNTDKQFAITHNGITAVLFSVDEDGLATAVNLHCTTAFGMAGVGPQGQQLHIADASASHTLTDSSQTVDRAQLEGILDNHGSKINSIISLLETFGFAATS